MHCSGSALICSLGFCGFGLMGSLPLPDAAFAVRCAIYLAASREQQPRCYRIPIAVLRFWIGKSGCARLVSEGSWLTVWVGSRVRRHLSAFLAARNWRHSGTHPWCFSARVREGMKAKELSDGAWQKSDGEWHARVAKLPREKWLLAAVLRKRGAKSAQRIDGKEFVIVGRERLGERAAGAY